MFGTMLNLILTVLTFLVCCQAYSFSLYLLNDSYMTWRSIRKEFKLNVKCEDFCELTRKLKKYCCNSMMKWSENICEKKEMCEIIWKRNVGQECCRKFWSLKTFVVLFYKKVTQCEILCWFYVIKFYNLKRLYPYWNTMIQYIVSFLTSNKARGNHCTT